VVVPAVVDAPELVCAPPVLAVTPAPFLGELLSDADPDEVAPLDDDPARACGDLEVVDPLLAAPLPADVEPDDESDPDDEDPSDVGSADAIPCPVKTAAPTPKATASPPTRPIYLEAPMASSCCPD
jgi:hypothetical protein